MSEPSEQDRPFFVPPKAPAFEPGSFQAPGTTPGKPPSTARMRRGFHVSTAATVALALPWLIFSLIVVTTLASLISAGNEWLALVMMVAFLLSGVITFLRPTESVLARVFFRVRPPTAHEQQRLQHVWAEVTRAVGIDGGKYELWVQESDDVNAFATAGHTVAVTRWALESLPPNQLAAVMAHELGHHLGGHAWASLLAYWYSIPARLLFRAVRLGVRVVLAVMLAFSILGWIIAVVIVGLIVVAFFKTVLFSGDPLMMVLFLTPLVAPLLLAWFSRLGEKYADRIAAELGYGPPLVEVLYGWMDAGQDLERSKAGWVRNAFASHPSCAARIRALERRMHGNPM